MKANSNKILIIFVLPALLLYSIFVLYPAVGGFWYSLTDWNGLNPAYDYVGFSNYIRLLEDEAFIHSLLFTTKYTMYMVVFQNVIAFLLALLVESINKGKVVLRTIFFFPNMISMVVGGFIWVFVFTQFFPFMGELLGIQVLTESWISDTSRSFTSILMVSLWGGVGYLMIIYIAALQGIPKELIEAAKLDGASKVQVVWHIIRPLIMNAFTIGMFVSLSSSFKVFDQVYAVTGGGPGRATQVISMNIFAEAFGFQYKYGYASAKAVVLFIVILIITSVQLRLMKNKEVEA